ncbi:ead/Ea22-like family protein [Pseudomonas aeruginosa]|uniref:ead/Ea22-like family protein n=1 Tax=Pseudomonas aeruginosa TaxID=287 RepID=UPI0026ECBDD9|nr:ead/Ea22-like family protein [Pseudomonas aeruginosa]HBO1344708.1 ead/Ea22-like family protein [Pseudomonas aeruginosa]HBO1588264.1 ead/Ea22-like family protein [Pseudomonas aeruginosa]HBO1968517.1 ead/Ea22-like family protein [Pseudomonas aeruginosa]HBO2064543.1 ead/Ea22-like family protein [Pseudomonas aeruginosa]HBO2278927.1 ead/Ea22-like family protein [Pseudomonas aeruginosa]
MTDHAELRRLSEVATPGEWRTGDGDDSLPDCVLSGEFVVCEHAGGDVDYIAAANPKTVLALLDEIDGLNDELSACTEHPGGCGYWREAAKRRAEERDRLRAQNDALRGALHAVQAEVDGNLRPLTRDLVNMVSGLNNGTHPNDIYDHCDEIERIIGAALEGDKQ